ncbi:c2 calcium-dependent membrane targeting [Anaeramoeba flamelloides]|uniref:C2 calcium-dependent membrane targeting n=1 Tax=Anaeramoeba flamelloides TaxID=1746091 RepID=A0AAV7YSJ4_9EUKA|nr:c2 calcium-dependent membrane targeting [Anaeramoeba flamelloides]
MQVDQKYLDRKGRATFQVRVHVIEARELKGKDSNAMSDPLVIVSIDKQKQNTKTFNNTVNCTYDHLFFYDFRCTPEEFSHKTLSLAVMDANTIRRNVLIGRYQMDLGFVYGNEGHEIWHKWMYLTNPEFGAESQGFLKASVIVLGPGDQALTHENDSIDDEEEGSDNIQNLSKMILKPPEITIEPYNLTLYCFRAEHLPKMDRYGKCDPFMSMKFGGNPTIKTSVKKKTLTAVWNEALQVPTFNPSLSNEIQVELFDWEKKTTTNDLISSIYFNYSDILLQPIEPRWINFYGPKKMQVFKKGVTDESVYRGRALIKLEAKKTDQAKLKMYTCQSAKTPKTSPYCLRFDLFRASELLSVKSGKVLVEFTVGEKVYPSSTGRSNNGEVVWQQQLKEIQVELPRDVSQIADLIINVSHKSKMSGTTRVGYLRIPFSDICDNQNSQYKIPRWHQLQPDQKQKNSKPDLLPGFLLFSMEVGKFSTIGNKRRKEMIELKLSKYQLRMHLYQGRNLPAADNNGLSDPYCMLRVGKFSAKSSRRDETLNPNFLETVLLDVDLPQPLSYSPNINVMVYDWDRVGSDDFLGRFDVDIEKIGHRMPAVPKWYKLYTDVPDNTFGEILASFQLIRARKVKNTPLPDLTPEHKECIIEISSVGLRNLLPYRMQKIKNPYIEFDLGYDPKSEKKKKRRKRAKTTKQSKSKKSTSKRSKHKSQDQEKDQKKETETEKEKENEKQPLISEEVINDDVIESLLVKTQSCNLPSGANANHLEVFRVKAKVPLSHLFAPNINVRVYDNKKISKPLVASGSISLAQFIPWADVPLQSSNLPPKIDRIPGAVEQLLDNIKTEKKKEKKKLEKLLDQIPINIEDANEELFGMIEFETPSDEQFSGIRTLPDVKEIDLFEFEGESNEEDETEDEDEENGSEDELLGDKIKKKRKETKKKIQKKIKGLRSGKAKEKRIDPSNPTLGMPTTLYELEHDFKQLPFYEWELTRGKVRGLSAFEKRFKSKKTNPNKTRVVGTLKGNIKIYDINKNKKLPPVVDLKQLFKPVKLVARVYILRGYALVPKDANGSSDPYIKIINGKRKENILDDRENYKKETLKPDFFKCYELPCTLPGNSELKIQVYDWDAVSADDLIGETVIDLENRWFNEEWVQMNPKPIEYRTLWNPSSSNPQGKIEMWLEILTAEEAAQIPQTLLELPKPVPYELRVCVWDTSDVVFKDKRMSDIFVTCQMNEGEKQKSDIHWRSMNGKGSFNWRYKFLVELPSRVPRLKVQLWDKDILNPNDSIGEAVLNLGAFFKKCEKSLLEHQIKKQWIDLTHPNFDGIQGKIQVQVSMLPLVDAQRNPVGIGRNLPNKNPFLPKPDRPMSSMAPWRIDKWAKFGWFKNKKYVYAAIACCICLIIIILISYLKFLL